METIVTVVHFITAILIIALVLMQQGKGAEMGASFGGGSSNTVFGSTGGGSLFGKVTTVIAVVFFATSLGLALFAQNHAAENLNDSQPFIESVEPEVIEESAPVMPVDELEFEEISSSVGLDDVESPALEMPAE
jgi:preprotein translocase subunit SecG